ncbi:MAG: hypothetical protein H6739_08620 [Alphaproteobacteria bacterium]|nr:hypothetical protein [Alphaproteobacteria bacterium]
MRLLIALPLALTLVAGCGDKDTSDDSSADDSGTEVDPCPGDVDADNDGSCDAVDCDPTDAYTYPGANEIPYDGKDNDCAGDGDLTDVDGDGHDGERAGGDDCNDGNPTVYPGATEICYDGIDQDCGGNEDTNDCDGDGFDGRGENAQDCDDNDPEIYPGQVEIWYNGVDNDCSGYNDSDYDADGDGDDHEDYEEGTDCDDTDPLTAGGNPERWDGEDRNCDGVVDNLDIGDGVSAWFGDRGNQDGFLGTGLALLDDYDGDGMRSVAAGGWGSTDSTFDGVVYVVDPADEGASFINAATFTLTGGEGTYFGMTVANAGDLDGDGYDELLAGGPLVNNSGGVRLYMGSLIAAGGSTGAGSGVTLMTGNNYVGFDSAGVGDVDGDGVDDLAVGTGWWATPHVVVYSGADALDGGTLSPVSALSQIDGPNGTGGQTVGRLDYDGDGLKDILVGAATDASGNIALVPGPDASSGELVSTGDLDRIRGSTGQRLGLTNGWMDDIDGNGYPEILVRAYGADGAATLGGEVMVIDSSLLLDGDQTASNVASFVVQGTVSNGHLKTPERTGDHDGDGVEDLLVMAVGDRELVNVAVLDGDTGTRATAWVHFSDEVIAGGTVLSDESDVEIRSENDDDLMGFTSAVGDVDGNGKADVVFGTPNASATAGGAWVLLSFLDE